MLELWQTEWCPASRRIRERLTELGIDYVTRQVPVEKEQRTALRAIVEHIVPGRWDAVRAPSENELKATAVLAIPIEEASAKIRTGPPLDDEEDHELPAWAGIIPLGMHAGTPQPDQRLRAGIVAPAHVSAYRRPGGP